MQTAAIAHTLADGRRQAGGQLLTQLPDSVESRSAHGSPFGRSCREGASDWNEDVAGAGVSGPQNDARAGSTYDVSRRWAASAVMSMSIVKPSGPVTLITSCAAPLGITSR